MAISIRLNDETLSKIDLFHRRNGMSSLVVLGGHDKHSLFILDGLEVHTPSADIDRSQLSRWP
jgi:hypothetical protein